MENKDYKFYVDIADYIRKATGDFKPEIGIILGSGLGGFGDRIKVSYELKYKDIPGFPVSTAPGHAGKLIFGELKGKKLMCMSGRFHTYEGYDAGVLKLPVYVMKLLGVEKLVVTNASGGINPLYKPGDVMIISDHIKFMGSSPLCGANIPEFGTRFPDMSTPYDPEFRKIAKDLADSTLLNIREGVYFFAQGPQFETPAEIKAMRIMGADAVGMSTVPEVIVANHCGIRTLGLSLVCNMAAGMENKPLSGDDVNQTAESVSRLFEEYMIDVISKL